MGYAGQGLRKEGCGKEGDQLGYIASGEHVINRVLSDLVLRRSRSCSRSHTSVQGVRLTGCPLPGPSGGGRGGRGLLRLRSQSSGKFRDRRHVAVFKEGIRLIRSKLRDGDSRWGKGATQSSNAFACRPGALSLLCDLRRLTFGRGGRGIAPARNAALQPKGVHMACTDKGRGNQAIWVFERED